MTQRSNILSQLSSRRFDVLVVGGGIVGAGIARDASMRGLKVALIEQGDFASGTSSRTSKLVHGGLRYLEHGRIGLVLQSLRERGVLRSILPEYIRPIELLLPVYAKDLRPAWKIRAGLTLYDWFARGRHLPSHRMLSSPQVLNLEPSLRIDGLKAAGLYSDCIMDDARVCLANVLQAIEFGAVCANYVRLQTLLKTSQRICGAAAEDVLSQDALEIHAEIVVNATGPWSDKIRRMSSAKAPLRLAPIKGSHIILPRMADRAIFAQARSDGRMLFLLPWNNQTLVGTTESALHSEPGDLYANSSDVAYLLEEANRIIPGRHLGERDVVSTYAGARPLLAFSGSSTRASREHRIEVDRWGLVSVMGGKYTTFRLMAQQVVDALIKYSRRNLERCLTDQVRLLEVMHPVALGRWREISENMDQELLSKLLTRYGSGATNVLEIISNNPSLIRRVCQHHDYIEAELAHAIQCEQACTIADVLVRRTRIAWSSCQGLDLISTVMELFLDYGGLSAAQVTQQAEAYNRFLAKGLEFRPGIVSGRSDPER